MRSDTVSAMPAISLRATTLITTVALFAIVGGVAPATAMPSSTVSAAAKTYANCTALNKVYKHGVGKTGARDKVSGSTKPVTNFKVSTTLYNANKKSDRDKDGVACEKR
jgi:hypothetical protein